MEQTEKPKLKDLTKAQLEAEALRIEEAVHQWEIDCARKIGFDYGQAAVIRQLASELEDRIQTGE